MQGRFHTALTAKSRLMYSRAFTLIEMLVVIAIVAVLAALLMPALQKALGSARMTTCGNNLRLIGFGFHQYAEDYHGRLPHPNKNYITSTQTKPYPWLINPYLDTSGSTQTRLFNRFKCPLSNSDTSASYGMNYYFSTNLFKLKKPGRSIMLGDSGDHFFFPNRWTKNYRYRHFDSGDSGVSTQAGKLVTIHGDLTMRTYWWVDGEITSPHDYCQLLRVK